MTRMFARITRGSRVGHLSPAQPCAVMYGPTPVAMSWFDGPEPVHHHTCATPDVGTAVAQPLDVAAIRGACQRGVDEQGTQPGEAWATGVLGSCRVSLTPVLQRGARIRSPDVDPPTVLSR